MPRHSKPTDLPLHSPSGSEGRIQSGLNGSPLNLQGVDLTSFGGGFEHDLAAGLTPLPPLPQSPPSSPRLPSTRDPSKTFLSSFKRQDHKPKDSRQGSHHDEDDMRPGTSNMSTKIYHLRKNPGSTPELSLVGSNENVHKDPTEGSNPSASARPQATTPHSEESAPNSKRAPFKLGVNRTKSIRRDSDSKPKFLRPNEKQLSEHQAPPKTAPLQSDWPGSSQQNMFFLTKDKEKRGKSAERGASESEENVTRGNKKLAVKNAVQKSKNVGSGFLTRLGKIGRSSSSHEKEVPDSEYVIKVINKPLVQQTRLTRISKQLSGCRDKTEYWMPSLPWRCIDFLNTHCEQEGLYRIPGSGPHVKHWQRRFDTELDIDLLSEEVRDTNEIASMLKAWLRELPSEIMPAAIQQDLAVELELENPRYRNVGEPVSQRLRNTLSELPPFNYYLLFAITCHLSLLLSHRERNKMDLNNLAVCVMPCLNLERWLFNYLVGDWRNCWQGCWTEKEYLKVEEMVEQGFDPVQLSDLEAAADDKSLASNLWATSLEETPSEAVSVSSFVDDRALSSGSGSGASKPPTSSSDGVRALSRRPSEQRMIAEGISPMTYLPPAGKGFPSNGAVGLGIEQDTRRPHTADQRYLPDDNHVHNQNSASSKSRSNSSTPKLGGSHNRSRSDLPLAPGVKNNNNYSDADMNYPVRPPA